MWFLKRSYDQSTEPAGSLPGDVARSAHLGRGIGLSIRGVVELTTSVRPSSAGHAWLAQSCPVESEIATNAIRSPGHPGVSNRGGSILSPQTKPGPQGYLVSLRAAVPNVRFSRDFDHFGRKDEPFWDDRVEVCVDCLGGSGFSGIREDSLKSVLPASDDYEVIESVRARRPCRQGRGRRAPRRTRKRGFPHAQGMAQGPGGPGLAPLSGGSPRPLTPTLAPAGADRPVRLTVEVAWTTPAATARSAEASEVELEVSEGQVVEAVAWPDRDRRSGAESRRGLAAGDRPRGAGPGTGRGSRRREPAAPRGGAGDAVPAPPGAGGAAADTPAGTGGDHRRAAAVGRRRRWTSGQGDDGVVAPGSTVPVTLGFNVLTPEPTSVDLRCTAELRPVARGRAGLAGRDPPRSCATNTATTTDARPCNVQVPDAEGTYVLELRATWEPSPVHDGNKLIGRLIRRGKTRAVRRVDGVSAGDAGGARAVGGARRSRLRRRPGTIRRSTRST